MHLIDMAGVKLGRLTVLQRSGNEKRGGAMWECQCSCGNITRIRGRVLRAGQAQSCGCLRNEQTRQRSIRHGLYDTRAYGLWSTARHRAMLSGVEFTLRPTDVIVPQKCPVFGIPLVSTGVRGSGPRFNSPTLDRIDSAKGYTPGNVWVISHRANSLKSNASLEESRKL